MGIMRRLTGTWHWLTDVTDIKTRRITLIGLLILCTFDASISRFVAIWAPQIEGALGLAIVMCSLGGIVLCAHAGWRGRRARSRRADHHGRL
jgi:hypothetical protein